MNGCTISSLKRCETVRGKPACAFFPLVLTLFLFILTANLIGMFPYAFTVTAHIIITLALALIVFATVTLYGVARNGFGFLRIFMPPGVPIALSPFIVPIEIISYFARPLSHSLRLFAVMLAGHITLKVFAQFAVDLADLGMIGLLGAILPLVMTVLITALELLMAVLQAYIFTLLTCMYLVDLHVLKRRCGRCALKQRTLNSPSVRWRAQGEFKVHKSRRSSA
ncbi:MAG: F0F1 ATP synthase subunit A [Terricaulis sp.]|nr:F0F1 ATP synthase subunit A [Terricaulis sp.]